MTLLDTLSSLPSLHPSAFPLALHQVATEISFDQDVKVQVFEMTIRALGSLLSTYQYLDRLPEDGDGSNGILKRYQGRLSEMALDLGERLVPAFDTPTGLPYARVNLRHGVEKGETVETCEFIRAQARRKPQNFFAAVKKGIKSKHGLASSLILALYRKRSESLLIFRYRRSR